MVLSCRSSATRGGRCPATRSASPAPENEQGTAGDKLCPVRNPRVAHAGAQSGRQPVARRVEPRRLVPRRDAPGVDDLASKGDSDAVRQGCHASQRACGCSSSGWAREGSVDLEPMVTVPPRFEAGIPSYLKQAPCSPSACGSSRAMVPLIPVAVEGLCCGQAAEPPRGHPPAGCQCQGFTQRAGCVILSGDHVAWPAQAGILCSQPKNGSCICDKSLDSPAQAAYTPAEC